MSRVLTTRILIGLVVAALVLLPIGSAMMPVSAMAAPDSMAQTVVEDQDSSCADCCGGCVPTAMNGDACMAQCTIPVAVEPGLIAATPSMPSVQLAQLHALGAGFTSAPASPPPKSAL